MIQLEEIVARQNYHLKVDWSCDTCGDKTEIYGIALKGEKSHGKHQITWNDIIHKKCNKNHYSIPVRVCNRCKTEYKFEESMCVGCNKVIESMLTLEQEYVELKISINKLQRKKQEPRSQEIRLLEVTNQLNYIGYKPCSICDEVVTETNKCKECNGK
jgi:hypothetical protein